jgi:hypothetical protein
MTKFTGSTLLAMVGLYLVGFAVGLWIDHADRWMDAAKLIALAGLSAYLISSKWARMVFDQLYEEEMQEKRRKESRCRCGND